MHLGNCFTIIRRPVGAGETETGNRPESTDSQSENDIVTPEALHRVIELLASLVLSKGKLVCQKPKSWGVKCMTISWLGGVSSLDLSSQ